VDLRSGRVFGSASATIEHLFGITIALGNAQMGLAKIKTFSVHNFSGNRSLVRSVLIVGYILAVLLISGLAHS
jgi:hypothetical protein